MTDDLPLRLRLWEDPEGLYLTGESPSTSGGSVGVSAEMDQVYVEC